MSSWLAVGWLLVGLVLLFPITRWFGNHLRGIVLLLSGDPAVALYVYFALLLPGTMVHELSHLVMAKLLGVRTGKVSFGPKPRRGGVVQFGAVNYQRPDALRESLIGLAPLMAGSALVLALAHWRFGLDSAVTLRLQDLPARLMRVPRAQDAWLWLYLIMAIANAMLPSASDRRAWGTVGLYLGLIVLGLYVVGALAHLPGTAMAALFGLVSDLAFAFTLTILLDVVIGGGLCGVELLLGLLLRRRIQY